MRVRPIFLLWLLVLTPFTNAEEKQLQLPKPRGWVSDFAKAIRPEAAKSMTDLCAEVDQKTHAQIAVVTINSTGQTPIADYAASLFNEWGIGHHDDNRGMLILLAISDHNWRITTGRGFEGLFPDERVARIGAEMVPDLKRQRYSEALLYATSEIADIIANDRGATLTTTAEINATKVALALLAGHIVAADWKKVPYAEGTFSILMPAKPVAVTLPLQNGNIKATVHGLAAMSQSIGVACGYSDFSSGAPPDPEKVFDGTVQGSLRGAHGTLLTEEKVTKEGYPGRRFRSTGIGNVFVDEEMYLVGRRFYLITITTATRIPNADIEKVFESFHFTVSH